MKAKNLLIYFLSLVMILSALTPLASVSVFAADDTKDAKQDEQPKEEIFDYLGTPFASDKAKLATMSLYFETDDYAIYGLEETGEVGLLVKATGQILLTNPYDVATSKSSDAVKQQLLPKSFLPIAITPERL